MSEIEGRSRSTRCPSGEGRTFAVDGEQIAVFRLRDGSLRALGRGVPAPRRTAGRRARRRAVVVCPLHGHTFDMCTGDRGFRQWAVGA